MVETPDLEPRVCAPGAVAAERNTQAQAKTKPERLVNVRKAEQVRKDVAHQGMVSLYH